MNTTQAFELMRASINRGTNSSPCINAADLDALNTVEVRHHELTRALLVIIDRVNSGASYRMGADIEAIATKALGLKS